MPDNWNQDGEGRYSSSSPWTRVTITSQMLPTGYGVDEFSQFVLYDLQKDWWPTASLFKVTSVEENQTHNQPSRLISYRVQEAPQYCVVDVKELVMVSRILPGYPHGFRIRSWMCERDVTSHGQMREGILDSFRVASEPAEYYRQFIVVNGVTVKADASVDPAAVEAGAEIVTALLSGRQDIVRCMARRRAALAIMPRDQTATSLPEFTHLVGTVDFTGRRRDSYDIRGLGGVRGRPVSAVGEEQLLGNGGPQHQWFPYRGLAAVHEVAHGIQNICFTQEDDQQWKAFYEEAVQAELYHGTHMMANEMEFFAVFSTGYFEVTYELGRDSDREYLKERFPMVFQALDQIYGGTAVPEKYRTWMAPQQ